MAVNANRNGTGQGGETMDGMRIQLLQMQLQMQAQQLQGQSSYAPSSVSGSYNLGASASQVTPAPAWNSQPPPTGNQRNPSYDNYPGPFQTQGVQWVHSPCLATHTATAVSQQLESFVVDQNRFNAGLAEQVNMLPTAEAAELKRLPVAPAPGRGVLTRSALKQARPAETPAQPPAVPPTVPFSPPGLSPVQAVRLACTRLTMAECFDVLDAVLGLT